MTLFSLYNLQDREEEATGYRPKEMFILTNMLLVGLSGLVLSGDIFNIYIFFEITSITAYILTSLKRDKKAYSGAIRYMIMGTFASIFLLIAIMSIYINIGSLNLITISEKFTSIDEKIQFLILLSLFIGLGIKVEIFPLNIWVVDIYQATHNKINGLFSAILSKAYIFLFFHIAYLLKVESDKLLFLASLGAVSFLIAELSAVSSQKVKRVFAYSTLGQIALLFIAFASHDVAVITGALFLIVVHSLTKLMLFLSFDTVERVVKSTKTEMFRAFKSPFLMVIFTVGFLSLLGLPPFGGFIAKITILKGLASMESYLMVGIILTVSLIEALYLFRLLGFMVESRENSKRVEIEMPLLPKIILGLIALSILYLGLFPQSLLSLSESIATTLIQGGAGV